VRGYITPPRLVVGKLPITIRFFVDERNMFYLANREVDALVAGGLYLVELKDYKLAVRSKPIITITNLEVVEEFNPNYIEDFNDHFMKGLFYLVIKEAIRSVRRLDLPAQRLYLSSILSELVFRSILSVMNSLGVTGYVGPFFIVNGEPYGSGFPLALSESLEFRRYRNAIIVDVKTKYSVSTIRPTELRIALMMGNISAMLSKYLVPLVEKLFPVLSDHIKKTSFAGGIPVEEINEKLEERLEEEASRWISALEAAEAEAR